VAVWIRVGTIIICTILGSGGFWAYLQRKDTRRKATDLLVMGLAYQQLVDRGLQYIDRGSISKDEYEDYIKYFHKPYKELGGNGVADRIMREVQNLPFRPRTEYARIFVEQEQERFISNVRVIAQPES
jgi:hypothetical protein